MIPSNIPRAIEILRQLGEMVPQQRITAYICHLLEDLEDPVAEELRTYIRDDLRANSVRRSNNVIECVLPYDLWYWAEDTPGIDNLMRGAWCDKMAYDLETKGELP